MGRFDGKVDKEKCIWMLLGKGTTREIAVITKLITEYHITLNGQHSYQIHIFRIGHLTQFLIHFQIAKMFSGPRAHWPKGGQIGLDQCDRRPIVSAILGSSFIDTPRRILKVGLISCLHMTSVMLLAQCLI